MSVQKNILALNQKFSAETSPAEILRTAFAQSRNCSIAFSGAEDVILIDMAVEELGAENISVFTLDTGRLHEQTYDFIERVRKHYSLPIEMLMPQAEALQSLTREKGLFSFYRDGHHECCNIRKIEPLRRKLALLEVWISGQRREQNESTRGELDIVELSQTPEGKTLLKFNPLAFWSETQVWEYIHLHNVPYNELHKQGFSSIGCAPCTRPTAPGQPGRAGRWWWEDAENKECGLHTETTYIPATVKS